MNSLYQRFDFRLIVLGIICLFPILKFSMISLAIILFILTCIIFSSNKEREENTLFIKHFIYNSVFFFLILTSITYSSDLEIGLKKIQQALSILIFPIAIFFLMPKMNLKKISILFWTFTVSCLVLTIYIYSELVLNNSFSSLSENNVKFWNNPFREAIFNLPYFDLHPTYYSLWLGFVLLFLTNQILIKKDNLIRVTMAIIVIFFGFTLLLFAARGPLLGFILAFIFVLLQYLKSTKRKIIFLFFLIISVGISVTQISFLKSRFVEEFQAQEFRPPVGIAHTSTNIRVGIYTCVFQIFRENPLFGVGVGDVQKELNECYSQFHTRVYQEGHYNTHSTYFNVLLSNGIIGLLFFLAALLYQLRLAFKSKNSFYLAFLILLFTTMLFENVLVRMHGAVFYGLFNSIFIKNIFSDDAE